MNKSKLIAPAILGVTAFAGVAGGSALTALTASADTTTTASTTAATDTDTSATTDAQQRPPRDESKGGHVGANGTAETLLTGDTATKATAAAQAAVSGGTVLRVETDAEGATYEAHVRKSDGTQVTVKMDENFKVTAVEDGPGAGMGKAPGSSTSSTQTN